MQDILTVTLYSYFIGSIPTGLILSKIFLNRDVRKTGSGNIGASNMYRTGGKIIGVSTLVLDCLKGYVVATLTIKFYSDLYSYSVLLVFLGHLFPIWLKFKGGKGVATYLGILFSMHITLPITFIIFWIFITYVTKYASLASLLSSGIILVLGYLLNEFQILPLLSIFLVLIIYSHKSNIGLLLRGSEKKNKSLISTVFKLKI